MTYNKLIKGNQLSQKTRQEVLRAYIYRWTSENDRRASAYATLSTPTIPLQTDEEWLAEHAFYVNKDGSLSRNHSHAEPAFLADKP